MPSQPLVPPSAGTAPSAPERGTGRATWSLARFCFLRLLGVAALGAFISLWNQGLALIGARGLTPVVETMAQYGRHLDAWSRWRVPTLFWLATGDGFIQVVVGTGLVCSVLLLLGFLPRAMCAACYVCFLSIAVTDRIVGTVELRWFNWPADYVLIEATFLAAFLAPRGWFPGLAHRQSVGRIVRYLLYWLAFRLFFGPGMAKVLSSDPQWLDLRALKPFLLMLPSPTPASPVMFEAPMAVHGVLTLVTLAFEVVGALMFAVPGWPRRVAALIGIGMMASVQASGNFRGLIFISVGLLMLLLDDRWLLRWLPARWFAALRAPLLPERPEPQRPTPAWLSGLVIAGALLIVVGGALPLSYPCRLDLGKVPGVRPLAAPASALGLANGYAMFAGMPNDRPGLVVQGSDDGETWLDYETLGGPENPRTAPHWLSPYGDYLGFGLWASARRTPGLAPAWLRTLQRRVLEADPVCLRLFAVVPFEERPPRQVRVARYAFRYTTPEQRRAGVWWQREWLDVFVPARTLAENAPETTK